jgi:hypothetical protein
MIRPKRQAIAYAASRSSDSRPFKSFKLFDADDARSAATVVDSAYLSVIDGNRS